jgi:hypothetical protein
MAITPKQYIKHNRKVIPRDERDFGDLARHDIIVTIILAYEKGAKEDSHGTQLNMNLEFLEFTRNKTNEFIKKYVNHKYADLKSYVNETEDYANAEVIPVAYDHKKSATDVSGYSLGLTWIEKYKGVNTLFIKGIIKDNEAKARLENDLIRATSLGTRDDGSISEISNVQNGAVIHGGYVFSEKVSSYINNVTQKIKNVFNKNSDITEFYEKNDISKENTESVNESLKENTEINLSENENHATNIQLDEKLSKKIELSEKIKKLESRKIELSENIIPNHYRLKKMIKSGKILSASYFDLIDKSPDVIFMLDTHTKSHDIGLNFGYSIAPIALSEQDNHKKEKFKHFFEQVQDYYSENETQTSNNKTESEETESNKALQPLELMENTPDIEKIYEDKIRHIKDLLQISPDLAKTYCAVELRECEQSAMEENDPSDFHLHGYLEELKASQDNIQKMSIELQEL